MSMKKLSSATIKLVSSTQVITSTSSVVKELVENAIDAQSTIIDIRIENYGLDKIEIRDNGTGISCEDVHVMCLPGYTSKLSEISDLDKLTSYGFRGEALSSICAVADVTVITKTDKDKYANTYSMDMNGYVKSSSITHHQKGTVIKVVELFRRLPVRKQLYSSKKHCVNDLRKMEYIVKSLSVIKPDIRVSLVHNKSLLWQKTPVNELPLAFGQLWSSSVNKCVKHLTFSNDKMNIELILPNQNIDVQNCFLTTTVCDAIFLYVNKRPIRDNKIEKLIVGEISNYFGHYLPPGKYLPCLISINVPPETIDVNLEPDKSRIFFHNQDEILNYIKYNVANHYYNSNQSNEPFELEKNSLKCNKRKLPSDIEENVKKPVQVKCNDSSQFCHKRDQMHDVDFFFKNVEDISLCEGNANLKPDAESTKIIDRNTSDSEFDNTNYGNCMSQTSSIKSIEVSEKHVLTDEGLSLEGIDFEEPFLIDEKENSSEENFANNKSDEKINNEINISNLDLKSTTLSQWSKGHFLLNGNPVNCGVTIIADSLLSERILHDHSDNSTLSENEKTETIKHKEKNNLENSTISIAFDNKEEKIKNNATITKTHKISAPLFRTVAVSDEQVPGLTHLVSRPQSWVHQPRSKRPVRETPSENFSVTIQSVSSQMGNKEMSGFTLFAKEMRIKILRENPGLDFTKVSQLLAKSWAELSANEKESYKNLANEQKTKPLKKLEESKKKKKNFEFLLKNLKRHTTFVNISLLEIKQNLIKNKRVNLTSDYELVGQIEENNWICRVYNKIMLLNISCLQESVTFFKKLSMDAIPLKIIDEPIIVDKNFLGLQNYQFLTNLSVNHEPFTNTSTVSDDRIAKNGFNITFEFNGDGNNPVVKITDIALHISIYGLDDLKEIIELMRKQNIPNLSLCRPLKVINYLRSETVRFCKNSSLPKSIDEINKLMDFWFQNEPFFAHNTCVHHKNVFSLLHMLNNDVE
ncbi:PMS1 protein homolog 1-like isoform X2 [Daktulosphaira vitifoliae]|uniref:PMS1 protein homolog 1-like isoform X2 n=1 Tax=Daktulosphaira vitifoliae TaxID=58002 RepID=UPI0021AA03A7|nr:PMS1 protein homolog 1-like isoform X2 [Daktulosphaira vitifoliae]